MKTIFRFGAYIWTAAGAGWLYLGVLTQLDICYVVSFGCMVMSAFWVLIVDSDDPAE